MTASKKHSQTASHAGNEGLLDPLVAFLGADDERVARIMRPLRARYVASERDDLILKHIKEIIENILEKRNDKLSRSLSNRRAGFGIAIVGQSGAGKSTTLEHIFLNHAAFPGYGRHGEFCSLVSVNAPSPCTRAQLGNLLLDALSYRVDDDKSGDAVERRTLPADEAWYRLGHQIRKQKRLVIHVGDMNHVMHQANPREIKKVTDNIKNLMNDKQWPVHFIFDGTPEMIAFPEGDRQLSRRLKFIPLENVTEAVDGEMIAGAIRRYAKDAGLKLVVERDDMLVGRLCRAAAFQMGLVFQILCDAIAVSLKGRRKTLKITDFVEAYAPRTMAPSLNIFLSPVWQTIDPSFVLEKPEVPDEPAKKSRRGRTKF
jgi:hypothetical protein